ncbi:GNAT family N-acetyltransferase [Streptomyces sp. NPDC020412]|uniref:GNAT family N-acetyltransferase n=1 Tax=Streptomyces sp. NPDC020412 TaxID=3365073 RepID=UPI0037BD4207
MRGSTGDNPRSATPAWTGTIQRRGVGRQLMESAVRLGESAGCYEVQLPAADDEYVHTFYEACGFKPLAKGFRRYIAQGPRR